MSEVTRSTFVSLQEKLVLQWPVIGSPTDEEKTMIVVPSLSVDVPPEMTPLIPAYEERFLFLLLLLRQPRARVIYLTSMPVYERIVDYYLGLVPGLDSAGTRERLCMISIGDPSSVPLSQKMLDRPQTLQRVRGQIPDLERAHLVPFNTTDLERELTIQLGVPMYGTSPSTAILGSKSGSRTIFEDEGVPHPRGSEHVHSVEGIEAAIARIQATDPEVKEFVVKLNHGVSGFGNGRVRLTGEPIDRCIAAIELEGREKDSDHYFSTLAEEGGIVEERLRGAAFRSPSVQLRVAPTGEVELLSTHDQVLGGTTGQQFLGARFPADPAYASSISTEAMKVGRRLAQEGVIGRFAVDFVTVSNGDGEPWRVFAIEINLRKGGTTHPFLTLQFLTEGNYDEDSARFLTGTGAERYYVATDHLEDESFSRLTPDDVIDVSSELGIRWDHGAETGVVWHMISAVAAAGQVGMTAIGESPEHADELYSRARSALEARARHERG